MSIIKKRPRLNRVQIVNAMRVAAASLYDQGFALNLAPEEDEDDADWGTATKGLVGTLCWNWEEDEELFTDYEIDNIGISYFGEFTKLKKRKTDSKVKPEDPTAIFGHLIVNELRANGVVVYWKGSGDESILVYENPKHFPKPKKLYKSGFTPRPGRYYG